MSNVYVLHEADNVLVHDSVCLHLNVSLARLKPDKRQFKVRSSWPKANEKHIDLYKNVLTVHSAKYHFTR